jgi:hypothetical protein
MAMTFNFDYSNMVLAIGGQILLIVFALIILFMGAPAISFPVANVKRMLSTASPGATGVTGSI